ncbi:MAG: PaaI family thioesterase [Candidatus Binatia bacterium]
MAERHYVLEGLFGDDPQILSHVPHCQELSMTALHAGPGEATLRIPFDPRLVGDPTRGVVFGGVITTLLDHTGGAAVMCSLETLRSIATIDLRIDYTRPATPGRDLIGHACCYRVTTHVAFVRGTAYHDDRDDPFATFLSTYMLGANALPAGILETLQEREPEGSQ